MKDVNRKKRKNKGIKKQVKEKYTQKKKRKKEPTRNYREKIIGNIL